LNEEAAFILRARHSRAEGWIDRMSSMLSLGNLDSSASVTAKQPRWVALLDTRRDTAPAVLRVTLGAVILPHGLQKVFGWFEGFGLAATFDFFAGLGVPAPVAALVIASDLVGSLLLIVGLGTRVAAAGAGLVMLGATLLYHAPNGFFMNWGGQARGEGFEFHLLAIGIATALMITGGGRASVDGWLTKRLSRP
jgi:putative oxidoreductase